MTKQEILGPKLFTLEEAEAALAPLSDALRRFQTLHERYEAMGRDLAILRLVSASGGTDGNPDAHALSVKESEQAGLLETLRGIERELQELGCVPKSYADGLVDFFSLRDGRLVFLCWRLGEDRIRSWHTLEGGFSGRRPIAGRP